MRTDKREKIVWGLYPTKMFIDTAKSNKAKMFRAECAQQYRLAMIQNLEGSILAWYYDSA